MEPFIGQIIMFAGNFAPRGWAFCQGQLLSISQNQALFSIIGTTYGGDGRTTFGLPDLRGRSAIGAGTGPGLSERRLGARMGVETVTLNVTQMPSHSHIATATASTGSVSLSTDDAVRETPIAGDVPAAANFPDGLANKEVKSFGPATNTVPGQGVAVDPHITIGNTGGNLPVHTMNPSLTVNYIICITGIFPSRS